MLDLGNINEVIKKYLEQQEQYAEQTEKHIRECARRTALDIERNRMVLPALYDLCPDLKVPLWRSGAAVEIDLGERPATRKKREEFSARLVRLRAVLGRLKMTGKEPVVEETPRGRGVKRVRVTFKSDEYPGVTLTYTNKLPRGTKAKCKLVKRTYYDLVCEA